MKVVVLTGAGVSAESGLQTFRDSDGLWEGHAVQDVATPEAWQRDPEMVQRFYNERRKSVLAAKPNAAHLALAALEQRADVVVITQNIDDLHERAGSTRVIHLHGEILKAQSSLDPALVYPIEGAELSMDACCERGSRLRPHVVWFGEPVPKMEEAIEEVRTADVFLVVGTSLLVYPAAGLVDLAPRCVPIWIVDPKSSGGLTRRAQVESISKPASIGVPEAISRILGETAAPSGA